VLRDDMGTVAGIAVPGSCHSVWSRHCSVTQRALLIDAEGRWSGSTSKRGAERRWVAIRNPVGELVSSTRRARFPS